MDRDIYQDIKKVKKLKKYVRFEGRKVKLNKWVILKPVLVVFLFLFLIVTAFSTADRLIEIYSDKPQTKQLSGNTYIDGTEFNKTTSRVLEILSNQASHYNDYVAANYDYIEEDLNSWISEIESNTDEILNMKHHVSYKEFMECSLTELNSLKEFIFYANSGDSENSLKAYNSYIEAYNNHTKLLANALTANNIKYTWREDGTLNYVYYSY